MKKRFFYFLPLALLAILGTQTICMAMENQDPDENKQIELYQEGTHLSDAPSDTIIKIFLFIPIEYYQNLACTCKGFKEIVLECARLFTGSEDPKIISQFFEKLRSTLIKEKQTIFLYRQLQSLPNLAQLTLPNFTPADLVGVHTIGNIVPNQRLQQAIESTIAGEIDGQEDNIVNSFNCAFLLKNIRLNLFLIKNPNYRNIIVAAIHQDHSDYKSELVDAAKEGRFDFVLSILKNLPGILPENGCEEKFYGCRLGFSQTPCKYLFLEQIFVAATKHFHFETVKFLLDNFKDNFWINNITQGLDDALENDKQQLIVPLWEAFMYKISQVKKFGHHEKGCLRDILHTATRKNHFKKILYLLENFKDKLYTSTIVESLTIVLNNIEKIELASPFWETIKYKLHRYTEKYKEYQKQRSRRPRRPNFNLMFDIALKANHTETIELIVETIQANAYEHLDAAKMLYSALENKHFSIAEQICKKFGDLLREKSVCKLLLNLVGDCNAQAVLFLFKHCKDKINLTSENFTPDMLPQCLHSESEYLGMINCLYNNLQNDATALLLYKVILMSKLGEFKKIEKFMKEVIEMNDGD